MHSKKWIIIGREELTWFPGEETDDGVMADRCYLLSSDLSLIFWFAGEEANDCVMDDRCYLLDLFFLWFSFCLCSVVSLPVFARSPYVFLLGSVTVSGAVAAEDGALELLLKMELWSCYWRRSRGRAAGLQRSHLLFLSSVRSSPCFFSSVFSGFPP